MVPDAVVNVVLVPPELVLTVKNLVFTVIVPEAEVHPTNPPPSVRLTLNCVLLTLVT